MQSETKKVARIQLYLDPYNKTISDTGIVFYNLDINTAVIEMEVIKNNYPLQISDENVDTYLYLQGIDANGNDYGQELDVEYLDPFGGLLSVTIPSDYLQTVNGSTILAQLYITLHKNNRVPNTKADTVVLNEFKFTVQDALINSISRVTKIEKIREFDKMRDEIRIRMTDIETAMKNGSDYVIRMENTLADGIKQINDLVAKAKKDINDTVASAQSSLNTTKDSAIKSINDTTTKNITDSNKAKQDVLDAITNAKIISKDTFDANNSSVSKTITDGDSKALSDAKSYTDNKQWQKYKLTNDDGTSVVVDKVDLNNLNLSSGIYYLTNCINAPAPNGYLYVNKKDSNYVSILFAPNNNNDVYTRQKNNGNWQTFAKITPDFYDTGWITLPLINGVQAYDNNSAPSYKLVINNGDKTLKLKGAVKGISTTNTVIGTIPGNVSKYIVNDKSFVENGSTKSGQPNFVRWAVQVTGDVKMENTSMASADMTATNWYPIDIVLAL